MDTAIPQKSTGTTLKEYPYNLVYFIDENKQLLQLHLCIIIAES